MSNRPLPPLKVGQVIFLIPSGERRVLPAQVTEEILRRTLSGQETAWNIKIAGNEKSIPLDPDAAEYYISIDELRTSLIDKVTQQIDKMIGNASDIAASAFKQAPQPPALVFNASEAEDPEDEQDDIVPAGKKVYKESETGNVSVVLPDGTRAKVRLN